MEKNYPESYRFHVSDHSQRLNRRSLQYEDRLKGRCFFAKGNFSAEQLSRPSIAIVGTRRPSAYGVRFVREFVPALRPFGWNVESGGALGIDIEAHAAALRHKIPTQAWLVGPLRSPSPRLHWPHFQAMTELPGCGLFVPEVVEPSKAKKTIKSDWLLRNQWLVASVDAVLVIEALEKSGTWSSVKAAGDMGIPVFVLPGPVFNPQSEGTNTMISEGSGQVVLGVGKLVKSLVVELGGSSYNYRKARESDSKRIGGVSTDHTHALGPIQYNLLEFIRNYLDQRGVLDVRALAYIADQNGYSLQQFAKALDWLMAQGELTRAGNCFERRGRLYEP